MVLSGNLDLASRRMASLSKISQALMRNSGETHAMSRLDPVNPVYFRIFRQLKVKWLRLRGLQSSELRL